MPPYPWRGPVPGMSPRRKEDPGAALAHHSMMTSQPPYSTRVDQTQDVPRRESRQTTGSQVVSPLLVLLVHVDVSRSLVSPGRLQSGQVRLITYGDG